MSELTKQQLTVENNSSFPNNNTGFITPTLLRTFNGNIIDSMVDEVTYNANSASWTSDIAALEAFSSSLTTNFVTPTQLSASSSTLQNNINTKLNTSSFNAYTASQEVISASFNSRINSVSGSSTDTGSLLTTASFNAYTQSASTNTSASINAATQSLSASVAAINATQLSTASFNTYTASAATNVSGAINTATQSLSSSVAAINAQQLTTASAVNNVITFTKGDGSTFPITVATGSGGGSANTGSLLTTASVASNVITFTKGDGSTFPISIESASFAQTASFLLGSVASASFATSASFALNGGVTQLLAGQNITISPLSGKGQVTISSTGTGSGNFNTATGSYGSFYDTTTQINPVANAANSMSFNETAITNGVSVSGSTNPFNTYIKTENAGVYNLQFSAQLDKTDSGTDSVDIWIRKNGIDLLDTGTTVTLTGNNDKSVAAWNWFVQSAANDYYQIIWSSADTDMRLLAEVSSSVHPGIPSVIATVNRVDQFLSNTGSFSGTFNGYNLTEFATTGSNTFKDTQTIDLSATAILTASAIIGNSDKVITDMYVNGGNYDTFNVLVSASNGVFLRDFNGVDTTPFLSVDTNGGNVRIPRNTNITGSLIISGASFNAKVSESALSVGVTTLDTLFESTASGVVSQIDLTRLGAGPTGDLTAVRLQTLSGSDTSGDTLLSRITTGVNRHTSTQMTGSVVNTTISSTWATGSGGTRVAYTSQINANAQSASATLTLTAGNSSNNFTQGTASISAGFIRIGAAQAHRIEVTGSTRFVGNTNISGSLNVSSSLTGDDGNLIRGGVTIVGGTNNVAVSIKSGSFELTTPQGSGSFYSNCPITSSGLRINGTALVNDLIISGVFSGNSTLQVGANASVSGNLFVSGVADISSISASKGLSLTGSAPTIVSGNLSGSLVSTLTDIYPSTPQGNFIVTLDSASMATLLSGAGTNANTIYFVI